jgi:hypothetical protein
MTGPDAAYEAAMREAHRQARIHGYGPGLGDVVFAAGWTAGVAEGRRQAAEDIRRRASEMRRQGMTARPIGMEEAARIAAGEQP